MKTYQDSYFPELCLTGYTIEDLFYQKRVLNEVNKQITTICEQTKDLDILFTFGCPMILKTNFITVP